MPHREYLVVEAHEIADSPKGLSEYLNKMAMNGWKVVTADMGMIFLVKEPRR